MKNLFKDESGGCAAEYSLLLGCILLIVFGAITGFSAIVKSLYKVADKIFPS